MDDEELRLECLKLCDNDTVKAADRFDFIKRRRQVQRWRAQR